MVCLSVTLQLRRIVPILSNNHLLAVEWRDDRRLAGRVFLGRRFKNLLQVDGAVGWVAASSLSKSSDTPSD